MAAQRPQANPAKSGPSGSDGANNSMFSSLRVRDFRFLWAGTLASTFAMNIQIVARGWLVYEMTQSALRLALVTLAFALPQVLFALLGGALADRLPKKTLMITAQSFNACAALVMAYFVFTAQVTFWHFIVLGVFNGTVLALSMPSRSSIIPEVVGKRLLMNAISLNSASMNLSRILGPVLAGGFIAIFHVPGQIPYLGVGIVYLIIAGLYCTAAFTVSFLHITGKAERQNNNGVFKDIGEGVTYIMRTPVILGLVVVGTLPMMFGMPLQNLMPAFNSSVLGGGPSELGLLQMAMGVGAITGTLLLARLGDVGGKGRLLLLGLCTWALAIFVFTWAPNLAVALGLAAFAALFSSSMMALNRTLLQLQAPDHMRGRIMSVDQMTHGFMPLGIVPIGILADIWGVQAGLQVSAGLLLGITLLCLWRLPEVRRLDSGHPPEVPQEAVSNAQVESAQDEAIRTETGVG